MCKQGSQSAGGSPGETFAAAHERASWRALWCSGYNPCPLNDVWEPSLLLSQPLPTSSHVVHSQPPWWGGRVPFGTFSSTGDHRPRSSLLALCHAVPGKEWCGQSQASPLIHTPMRSNFFFLPTLWGTNFSSGNSDFHKGSLISVFQRLPGLRQRRAGAGSQATAGSTIRTKVCVSITQCSGGWDSSWTLWYMVLYPTDLTETICGWMLLDPLVYGAVSHRSHRDDLWMDAKLLLLGWGSEKSKWHLTLPSCRHGDCQGGEGCYWHLVAREAAKHPTASRMPPAKNDPVQNANRAKLKKSWWIIPLWKGRKKLEDLNHLISRLNIIKPWWPKPCSWCTDRQIDQWDRLVTAEIDLYI